jgi:uncharacterized damage-inducible protein DinB
MRDYAPAVCRLVEYEIWCNLGAVSFLNGLSQEEIRRDFGFGLRTPHRTIFHIADVLQGWSGSVGPKVEGPSWLHYDSGMSLQAIEAIFKEAGARWLAAVTSSHEQGLLADGGRLNHVFHLVTHGSHHRGQLLSMLTLMGHSQPFEGGDFGGWANSAARTTAAAR